MAIGGLDIVTASGVVVAALSRNVVGVDAAAGRELWSYAPPRDTIANPQPGPGAVALSGIETDDETAYVPAWGASVSALDIRTGRPRWIWQPSPAPEFRSGAEGARLSGDTLFINAWHALNAQFSRSEAWLVALDRRTGRELWRVVFPSYTLGTVVRGRPALWRNLVFVSSAGGYVFAVDRSTQAIVWRHEPEDRVNTTDAVRVVYADVLYADAGGGILAAFDPGTGNVVWRANMLTPASSELLVTDRRVYANNDGFISILDRATGRYLARRQPPNVDPRTGGALTTPAAAAGREIYITVFGGAWSFVEP